MLFRSVNFSAVKGGGSGDFDVSWERLLRNALCHGGGPAHNALCRGTGSVKKPKKKA